MTFDALYGQPRDGHVLTQLSVDDGVSWCIRCGAVLLEARPGVREEHWEAPCQGGRTRSSVEAPQCLAVEEAGAANVAGDMRLMLHALTHGWRCEPVTLPRRDQAEAWRWSREGLLGGEAWCVIGAWADGPVVDDEVRRALSMSSARTTPPPAPAIR